MPTPAKHFLNFKYDGKFEQSDASWTVLVSLWNFYLVNSRDNEAEKPEPLH